MLYITTYVTTRRWNGSSEDTDLLLYAVKAQSEAIMSLGVAESVALISIDISCDEIPKAFWRVDCGENSTSNMMEVLADVCEAAEVVGAKVVPHDDLLESGNPAP